MFFHKNKQPADKPANNTAATPKQLSGDSTVAEWLEHPAGGALFREMLDHAGQKESALRPVRRMPMNRLIKLSKGEFTQEMLDSMIHEANSGTQPAPAISTETPAAPTPPNLPTWQEKIVEGRFAGKTIIVTGAGSGIGRATASRVAREGGRVIAVDISQERLDELKTELSDTAIETVTGDISSTTDIANIIAKAGDTIDGLANVAGIMDNMTPLHEMSDDIWNKVMKINVHGMMLLSRAALPKMLAAHKGTIVNIGSEASLRASAAGTAYTTSKHAVVGLSKSMAFMYGPSGIRTNVVAPGATLTNIEAHFDSTLGEERVGIELGTIPDAAEADQVAAAITFLLSDDSTNINGAILPSDGGWSVQ
jgi:NAD(P)-dependent dehydrogenase (short-subunit alcohol dehydrogenase family)